MKFKKLLSVVVVASMAMSIAGCSSNVKKYTDALDDLGFEQVEYKDIKDVDLNDPDDSEFEDGVYVVAEDAKEIKKLVKKIEDAADVDVDDVSSIIYSVKSVESDDQYSNFGFFVINFTNEDSAEDYFEEMIELTEEQISTFEQFADEGYGEYGFDDGDGYAIGATDIDINGNVLSCRFGAYQDGKSVIIILSIGYYDDADEFSELAADLADALDLKDPEDAL